MAAPDIIGAFIGHLVKMIDDLQSELAPYVEGTQRVTRRAANDWVDITNDRIEQIKREIVSIENIIAKHR